MSITRPIVGTPEKYHDHLIAAFFVGPDLIVQVDGMEIPNFYLTAEAARAAGKRYVDDKHKASKKPQTD